MQSWSVDSSLTSSRTLTAIHQSQHQLLLKTILQLQTKDCQEIGVAHKVSEAFVDCFEHEEAAARGWPEENLLYLIHIFDIIYVTMVTNHLSYK